MYSGKYLVEEQSLPENVIMFRLKSSTVSFRSKREKASGEKRSQHFLTAFPSEEEVSMESTPFEVRRRAVVGEGFSLGEFSHEYFIPQPKKTTEM